MYVCTFHREWPQEHPCMHISHAIDAVCDGCYMNTQVGPPLSLNNQSDIECGIHLSGLKQNTQKLVQIETRDGIFLSQRLQRERWLNWGILCGREEHVAVREEQWRSLPSSPPSAQDGGRSPACDFLLSVIRTLRKEFAFFCCYIIEVMTSCKNRQVPRNKIERWNQ